MDDIVARRRGAGLDKSRPFDVSLRQLQIFWAVAHSDTLTGAAKQLGLAQPSLSQQLSKLESTVGSRLFHRRSNELVLTEAGRFLLPKAEQVLRNLGEFEEGLRQFSAGQRVTIRLAGVSSLLRVLLPGVLAETQAKFPRVDFDIQEAAPTDIVEMLYGRLIHVGLLAANSVAEAGIGFLQVPLIEDPYVLVVPEKLNLDGIADPAAALDADALALLGRYIQFNFGTQHAKRVEDWYLTVLPESRVIAQCRSFEIAIGLVKAELGVCLVPALSTLAWESQPTGVRLYRVDLPPRRLVAMLPSQYRRQEPYSAAIDGLVAAAAALRLPDMLPPPPFLANAAESHT
ncbi:MAG TPA: LysR family transcriptional regulator [Devosia sp.]|nr:LysR family transcriptional regulator [Devosia sp.]